MSQVLAELELVAEGVYIRPMLTLDDAIGLFLARGFADKTRADYGRILDKFTDGFPRGGSNRSLHDVAKVTEDDCLLFLAGYHSHSKGYRHTVEATLASFFRWLYVSRKIKTDPMALVERTRRPRPGDLDVTRVREADVHKLLAACETWPERLCLGVLLYMGPRRHAVAMLRLRDYDRDNGLIRFREKGAKTIWKPVPDELAALIEAAIKAGVYTGESEEAEIAQSLGAAASKSTRLVNGRTRHGTPFSASSDLYLIPAQRTLSRRGDRDDRCIWRIVKTVADRAGVQAHVHALRAAFAVFYLKTHERDVVSLQSLLGHASIETTMVYLRELDRRAAMETVRDLSWVTLSEEVRA